MPDVPERESLSWNLGALSGDVMAISDEELARAKKIRVEQVPLLRRSRGVTNETLQRLPDAAVRRALRRLNYPDLPNARWLFRLDQERGDDGTVPAHAQGTALDRTHARLAAGEAPPAQTAGVPTGATREGLEAGPTPTAGMQLAAWEWLGPGNIGGRTRGIAIHPEEPRKMWAAGAGGGVWHTEDGGGQWAPVDDFLGNLACSCLAMDPGDPSTIYVDDDLAVAGALEDGAAFVSSDGGRTWQTATQGGNPWSGRVELAHAAADPRIVYASVQMTSGRIYRSTDGGRTYHPRKTLDSSGQMANYLGDQGWYGNAVWAGDPTDENLVVLGGVE